MHLLADTADVRPLQGATQLPSKPIHQSFCLPWQVYERPEEDYSLRRIFLSPSPSSSYQQPQKGQLRNRVIFGLLIGLSVLGVVLAGGWLFTVIIAATVWIGMHKYFDLVQRNGILQGMVPPPPVATEVCCAICSAMPLLTQGLPTFIMLFPSWFYDSDASVRLNKLCYISFKCVRC